MKVIVVAAHPDDETLGCGGTILDLINQGAEVHWMIMTSMTDSQVYSERKKSIREAEIKQVAESYGFADVHKLNLPTARLDTLPLAETIQKVKAVFSEVQPQKVFTVWSNDAHSDHAITYRAVCSCAKWFRLPSLKSLLAYETLSETDFSFDQPSCGFVPNYFVDISPYLEDKLSILSMYKDEIGDFPFPRSELAVRSLAHLRGVAVGCRAAEGFTLLRGLE